MMRAGIVAGFVLAMAFGVSGCVTAYTYGGAQYQSRAAAEGAQRSELQAALAGVAPGSTRIPGRAVVIVPDYSSFRHRGFTAAQNAAGYGEEQFDYVTRSTLMNLRFAYDALERAQLFDSVAFEETSEVALPIRNNYEHLIWFKLVDAETAGWLYYTSTMPEPVPAQFDTTIPRGTARANAWLKMLAEVASKHVARRGSPPAPPQPAVIRTLN